MSVDVTPVGVTREAPSMIVGRPQLTATTEWNQVQKSDAKCRLLRQQKESAYRKFEIYLDNCSSQDCYLDQLDIFHAQENTKFISRSFGTETALPLMQKISEYYDNNYEENI